MAHLQAQAERIALLFMLQKVPSRPSNHQPIVSRPWSAQDYDLPFERERKLCDTLAFLSGLSEDPNHIPAVAIEECPGDDALQILVAVNQQKFSDGLSQLQRIQSGFEEIFKTLWKVSSSAEVEQELFRKIVLICSPRISQRLRLTKQSHKEKKPLDIILQSAVSALKRQNVLFLEKARALLASIKAWGRHQTNEKLATVVEDALNLARVPKLEELLGSIRNNVMDPGERSALLRIVQKVGRYREAARFLYRTAKKYKIARNMVFKGVSLPSEAFSDTRVTVSPAQSLESALKRAGLARQQLQRLGFLWGLFGLTKQTADERFFEYTRMHKHPKVHAEMQLLYHFETSRFTSSPPSRVVCSSKDACFLCHAAITLHGKLHVHRSHGGLYPGWTLPRSRSLEEVSTRLSKYLDDYICQSISTMITRRQRLVYPDPQESTLGSLMTSVTTLKTQGSVVEAPLDRVPDDTGGAEVSDDGPQMDRPHTPTLESKASSLATAPPPRVSESIDVPSFMTKAPLHNTISDVKPSPDKTLDELAGATLPVGSIAKAEIARGQWQASPPNLEQLPTDESSGSEKLSGKDSQLTTSPIPESTHQASSEAAAEATPIVTTSESPSQSVHVVDESQSHLQSPYSRPPDPPRREPILTALKKGQGVNVSIGPSSQQPQIFEAWPIRLHLEWEGSSQTAINAQGATEHRTLYIELVLDEEVEALRQDGQIKIVAVDTLSECSISPNDLGRLCLYARGTFMRVCSTFSQRE